MTTKRVQRGVTAAAMVLLAGLLTGCWGVWSARDDGPSTDEARTEYELIPDASLAKEDTSPEWQLGRYVFMPGADRLLVISRITSWTDRPTDGNEHPVRQDRQIERVWITIPYGTPIGQSLKLEELESQFLVGYDAGDIQGKCYVQPSHLLGTIKVLDEQPDHVSIAMDVVIQPAAEHDAWLVKDTINVPVVAAGVHAKPAVSENVKLVRRKGGAGATSKPATATTKPAAATAPSTLQPSPYGSTSAAAAPRILGDKSVAGKWRGDQASRDVRLQFNADGRFAISTTPGAASPAPLIVGTYDIKGDQITLNVDKAPSEGGGPSGESAQIRGSWSDNSLVLTGNLPHVQGTGSTTLVPAQFLDMQTRIAPHAAPAGK